MTRIRATYRISSPMFLGGAGQEADNAIRIPSFKGALRFWWRALALARHHGRWEAVRAEELELLGSAEQKIGQSRVSMALAHQDTLQFIPTGTPFKPGTAYLAGQGLYHFNTYTKRTAICADVCFTVQCYLRRNVTPEQGAELIRALRLLGTCGGLGSRTRRGLGSIVLESWEVDGKLHQETLDGQHQLLVEVLQRSQQIEAEPPYSAVGCGSRLLLLTGRSGQSAQDLLEELGSEMIRYRAYGRMDHSDQHRTTLGEQAEQNFASDHDQMRAVSQGHQPPHPPQRAVFGLPHNYFFSSEPRAQIDIGPTRSNRRASPLLLHVQQRDDEPAVAVVTFLPAQFLPHHETLTLKPKRGSSSYTVEARRGSELWEPIHTFLDRLLGQATQRGRRTMMIAEAREIT